MRTLPRGVLGILCLASTLLFSLPAYLSPTAGNMLGFAAPVPVGVAFLLGGRPFGAGVVGLAAAITALAAGWPAGLFYILEPGLTGLLLAFGLRRGVPVPALALIAAGPVLLAHQFGVVAAAGSLTRGLPALAGEMHQAVDLLITYLAQEVGPEARLPLESIRETAVLFLPGLFAVGALLNAVFGGLVIGRLSAGALPSLPRFEEWRVPDHLIWPFIALAFAGVADWRLAGGSVVSLILVFLFFYTAQGSAVALHLVNRKGVSSWLIFIMGVVVMLQPLFLAIFLVVGLLDFRFDFRKPRPPAIKSA
jgi:hypothetical protein